MATAAAPADETMAMSEGANSVSYVEKYCLRAGSVGDRKTRLEADGWIERFDPAQGWPSDAALRVFTMPGSKYVITITSPATDRNFVRDCIVDGKGVAAKEVIDAALDKWGRPEQSPDHIYYWPQPKQSERTILIANSMVFQDTDAPAFALVVRFGPSQYPTKED